MPTADERAGTAPAETSAAVIIAAEISAGEISTGEMAFRRSDWQHPAGRSRAEQVADWVTSRAADALPGTRLGTKEEVRARCGVSVGTFNEALRLLQTRELITVRPGPGGGLFVADRPPVARLGNSLLELDTGQATVSDAIRIRDALDPLLVEDALWHASPADLAVLRARLEPMAEALASRDAVAFVQANWQLHAQLAAISPNQMLRALYGSLLELIEGHTAAVLPAGDAPLPDYLEERYRLHAGLVAALERRDAAEARRLITAHSTQA